MSDLNVLSRQFVLAALRQCAADADTPFLAQVQHALQQARSEHTHRLVRACLR